MKKTFYKILYVFSLIGIKTFSKFNIIKSNENFIIKKKVENIKIFIVMIYLNIIQLMKQCDLSKLYQYIILRIFE